MKSDTPQAIYLKDYAPSPYRIERVALDERRAWSPTSRQAS